MSNFEFLPEFVFRSPRCSIEEKTWSIEQLKEIATSSDFQETIYVSSPILYDEMHRWLKGELTNEKEISKLTFSLYKYLSRMRSRSTPFGLMAGCGTGSWGNKNEIILEKSKFLRHTRFDMDFTFKLAQYLSELPFIKPHIKFYCNNSHYSIGNQIRYVEYKYFENKRIYSISSIDNSEYLSEIIEKSKYGVHLSVLIDLLVKHKISTEDAISFIQELIDCQVLFSELEPLISGSEFINQLLGTLNNIKDKGNNAELNILISLFNKSIDELRKIDKQIGNEIKVYRKLWAELKMLNIPIQEKYLFQVDSFFETKHACVDKDLQKEILKALTFINQISFSEPNKDLVSFKKRYFEKNGAQELPLLQVLDTEIGIGYPMMDTDGLNNLVGDLKISQKKSFSPLNWNWAEEYRLTKLIQTIENGDTIVKFTDADLKVQPNDDKEFPYTLSVMMKMINASEGKLQLLYAGRTSSGANLLTRFSHFDKKILNIVESIVSFEEKQTEKKIIAEIIHLPESRTGNILKRPIIRKYEIPFLAKSILEIDYQIPLQDILVSIKNNRIVLRSRRLNKEIIPRLSSAHNYKAGSLPVYKFLCDLQLQDFEKYSLSFWWGAFANVFKFLPRAEFNKIVLMPAAWNFESGDFDHIIKSESTPQFMKLVTDWQKKWKMPRKILLKEFDNELLVDFENELNIRAFFDHIKNESRITVIEFLFDENSSLVKDESGAAYRSEIIATIVNHSHEQNFDSIKPNLNFASNSTSIKRSFIPGSEWLYYKIYCGVKTADDLLWGIIKPIIENLSASGLIEKWFFIRYADPDIHIRLRFYNSDFPKLNEVMKFMNTALQRLHEQGIISKIMTDTYVRELERYGSNSMEISESLFETESRAALYLLQIAQGDIADDLKWGYAIRNLDNLMDCFGLDISRKLNLTDKLKTSFIAEHSTHKDMKIQLDNKFRIMRSQLNEVFAHNLYDNNSKWPIAGILNWNKTATQTIADQILKLEMDGKLTVNLDDLIASYMHMSINRIFKSQQRKHEMVIYDQLYRYYKSKVAQEKSRSIRSGS